MQIPTKYFKTKIIVSNKLQVENSAQSVLNVA